MSKDSASIKIFFACTFDENMAHVVEYFLKKFQTVHDFDAKLWKSRDPKDELFGATVQEIKSCDAFVGVITEGSLWPSLEATVVAREFAKKKDKKICLFIERSVENKHIYRELTPHIFEFDRINVNDSLPQIQFVITDLLKLCEDYRMLSSNKSVKVFRSGLGEVEYTHHVKVSQKNTARLRVFYGEVAITKDVAERNGYGIPPIQEMMRRKIDPLREPTFSCRIISGTHKGEQVLIAGVDEVSQSEDGLCRGFNIVLNRWIGPKEELKFAWGFSIPSLFKTVGGDSTTYRAYRDVARVSIDVSFATELELNNVLIFKDEPHLVRLGMSGIESTVPPTHAKITQKLRETAYIWPKTSAIKKGEKLSVRWDLGE